MLQPFCKVLTLLLRNVLTNLQLLHVPGSKTAMNHRVSVTLQLACDTLVESLFRVNFRRGVARVIVRFNSLTLKADGFSADHVEHIRTDHILSFSM